MRWLRHKNGNGQIDDTSEADNLSLIDRTSSVEKKSSVWSSAIKDSVICRSTITGTVIENSIVTDSLITGGQISDSFIECELIADAAMVKDSEIRGKSRIAHTAYIENCKIANFTVSGDARLIDWTDFTDGKEAYISHGTWRKPPKILRLEGGLTMTESIKGFAYCGCKMFEISHWLKIGDRYGKKLGLTPEEVQQIREFLHTLP